MTKVVHIKDSDNVAVSLSELQKGTTVNVADRVVTAVTDIPQGHKIALCDVAEGEPIVKYGHVIGYAKEDIAQGAQVHTHNVRTGLGEVLEYKYTPAKKTLQDREHVFFNGYKRANGKVGVRNEVWIIPVVGCVNALAKKIETEAKSLLKDGVDDVIAFTHPYGCSQMGEDQENTRKILANIIEHPNAGAVLVLGLGCENTSVAVIKEYLQEPDSERLRYLVCQDVEDEFSESMKLIEELIDYASAFKREPVDAENLIIGMKCGGSDGLSGITANPSVGVLSDTLISKGGSTILTEVPEFFGAEDTLLSRADSEETFNKTADLVNHFKNYFLSHGQIISDNPSPGNKSGGITTLEDKALGNVQKSGTALVSDVLDYGDKLQKRGLNLLYGPGNDGVSVTAMAAAGAQIVVFTTGRGTPFGTISPTIKVATNNKINSFKNNWIDFNAGVVTDGQSIEETGKELFEFVLEVAEGKKTKAEELGYRDIAIFKQGVTL